MRTKLQIFDLDLLGAAEAAEGWKAGPGHPCCAQNWVHPHSGLP